MAGSAAPGPHALSRAGRRGARSGRSRSKVCTSSSDCVCSSTGTSASNLNSPTSRQGGAVRIRERQGAEHPANRHELIRGAALDADSRFPEVLRRLVRLTIGRAGALPQPPGVLDVERLRQDQGAGGQARGQAAQVCHPLGHVVGECNVLHTAVVVVGYQYHRCLIGRHVLLSHDPTCSCAAAPSLAPARVL